MGIQTFPSRKRYSLEEAKAMLENKRGDGKRKATLIHLDVGILFLSGKPGVETMIMQLLTMIEVATKYSSDYSGCHREVLDIHEISHVETEHDENPEFK